MRAKKPRRRAKNTYSVYKKLYRRAEKSLKKQGYEMFDRMLTRTEFWDEYRSATLKNKQFEAWRKNPKASGVPKKYKENPSKIPEFSKNITRDIVNSQTFSRSYAYAKNLKNALEKYYEMNYGKENVKYEMKKHKVTIRNIRADKIDFGVLDDEYWYLQDQGYTWEEAADIIAGEYFPDSP